MLDTCLFLDHHTNSLVLSPLPFFSVDRMSTFVALTITAASFHTHTAALGNSVSRAPPYKVPAWASHDSGDEKCSWWYTCGTLRLDGWVEVDKVKRMKFPFKPCVLELRSGGPKFLIFISGPPIPPKIGEKKEEGPQKEIEGTDMPNIQCGSGFNPRHLAWDITLLLTRLFTAPSSLPLQHNLFFPSQVHGRSYFGITPKPHRSYNVNYPLPCLPTCFVALPACLILHLHQHNSSHMHNLLNSRIRNPFSATIPSRRRTTHILPYGLLLSTVGPPTPTISRMHSRITLQALAETLGPCSPSIWSNVYLPAVRVEGGIVYHGGPGSAPTSTSTSLPPFPDGTAEATPSFDFVLVPGTYPLHKTERMLEREARKRLGLSGSTEGGARGFAVFKEEEVEKELYTSRLPASWWLPGDTSGSGLTHGRTTRANLQREVTTWDLFFGVRIARNRVRQHTDRGLQQLLGEIPDDSASEDKKADRGERRQPWLMGELWIRQYA